MRSKFGTVLRMKLVVAACLIAGARAGAQNCGFTVTSQPSSQNITNTSGDSFQDTLTFGTTESSTNLPSPEYFHQFRKGGAGFGDFGPWSLTQSGSGSGGWFTGNSNGNGGGDSGNDIGYAWGLWANSGELVNAVRLLSPSDAEGDVDFPYNNTPQVLPVGATLGIDMDNGYITSGSSVGVSIQNAEGQNLWEWYFSGGASDYSYHDNSGYNSSTLGWSQTGMHIAFTLTSTNTYTATVTLTSGGSFTTSGTLISESDFGVAQARAFNYTAGSGSAYDFFVNNISILDKSDNAYTSTYLSPRSWSNGDGSGWDLHNGSNSGFFLASSGISSIWYWPPPSANCWGIYANSGDVADAIRPFGQPVYVNDQVGLTMQNGDVSTGSSVGFGLQSGATNRFEFFFKGGNTDYSINDSTANRDSGIPWTSSGLSLTFTLTSTNTYSLSVAVVPAGTNVVITGTLEGVTDTMIDRIRLFNASAGSGSSYNLYFSSLSVGETTSNQNDYNCSPNFNCAVNTKFDLSGFYGSSWSSGQDFGYSVLDVNSNPNNEEPLPYTGSPINLLGGRNLKGTWDDGVASYNGNTCYTNSPSWYINVIH